MAFDWKKKKLRTHDENCLVICAGCFRNKLKGVRNVTKELEECIQVQVFGGYSLENKAFPRVLCSTCRITLLAKKKDPDTTRLMPPIPNYREFVFPAPITRKSSDEICICTTCREAREQTLLQKQRIGNPSFGIEKTKKLPSKTINICETCFQVKAKGISHKCSKVNMEKRIAEVSKSRSLKGQGKITSSLLTNQAKAKGISKQGGVMDLPTGGRPLTVQVGKPRYPLKRPKFKTSDLRKLQRKFKFSDKATLGVASAIRVVAGKNSVEKGLAEQLPILNREHLGFYYTKNLQIKVKNDKELNDDDKIVDDCQEGRGEQVSAVIKDGAIDEGDVAMQDISQISTSDEGDLINIGNIMDESGQIDSDMNGDNDGGPGYHYENRIGAFCDPDEVLSYVMQKRELDPEKTDVKCGADGGQGSLKVAILTQPKEMAEQSGRSSYSDGVAAKDSLLSSVNRLVLLGLIPSCPENHFNVSQIMEELKIEGLEFLRSIDIKLILILLGKSGGNALFGCPFCNSSGSYMEKGDLYTINRLQALHEAYIDAGRPLKQQREFENVVNQPILTNKDPEKEILDLVTPPELHLLIGTVDKLLTEFENRLYFMESESSEKAVDNDIASKEMGDGGRSGADVDKGPNSRGDDLVSKDDGPSKKPDRLKEKEEKRARRKTAMAEKKAKKASLAAMKKVARAELKAKKKIAATKGRKFVDTFLKLKEVAIVRKSYQGQHSLEGNQSRSFLKKLGILEEKLKAEKSEVVENGLPFIAAFKAFDRVVETCFGNELKSGHEQAKMLVEKSWSGSVTSQSKHLNQCTMK